MIISCFDLVRRIFLESKHKFCFVKKRWNLPCHSDLRNTRSVGLRMQQVIIIAHTHRRRPSRRDAFAVDGFADGGDHPLSVCALCDAGRLDSFYSRPTDFRRQNRTARRRDPCDHDGLSGPGLECASRYDFVLFRHIGGGAFLFALLCGAVCESRS